MSLPLRFPSPRCLLLLPLLLLAACAAPPRAPETPPVLVKAPPPPPPEDPLGVPTHRFEFDPAVTDVLGVLQSTVVGKDDALPDIARRFNLGYEEIVRANPGVDPWLPGEGRRVLLPTRFVLPDAPREGLVVNLAAMRLFWFPKREPGKLQVVYTYPIGIGRVGWVTPEGTTRVITRVKDPAWRPPLSVRKEHAENGEKLPALVPPGPDNPLGAHMFRLGWPSYLIHGTNKPYGVGMRSSHGCLRLYPEDIAKLYEQLPIGTKVTVVNQPFVLGWEDGRLHAQGYEVLEDDKRDWRHAPRALRKRANANSPLWKRIRVRDAEVDWEGAHQVALKPLGIPVAVMKAPTLASMAAPPPVPVAPPPPPSSAAVPAPKVAPAAAVAPAAEMVAVPPATPPVAPPVYPLKGVSPALASRVMPLFAAARAVRNAVPPGGNWSGRMELRVDEAQFRQMQAEIEAPASPALVPAAKPPVAPAAKPPVVPAAKPPVARAVKPPVVPAAKPR